MRSSADEMAGTYGLGAGPWTVTPVARGALGQIWKLSGSGSSWAVKELLFGCDEEQVRREAALRQAAERLGIASPRLLPDRRGAHVTRLRGGSFVKLYDWIEGTPPDVADPDVLDWFGRTMALLHTAGAGAGEAPDPWYERCPGQSEWRDLHARVRRAGLPWADALGRFVATSAVEQARWVTPSRPGDRVTSHLDLQPQNVLVGRDGPVLLDWDNAGSVAADREFAQALFVWSGRNEVNAGAARRLARAYRDAGGPAVVTGPESFSTLFATALNYVYVQAECALDPEVTEAQREFAGGQVVASLRGLPDRVAVERLMAALDSAG